MPDYYAADGDVADTSADSNRKSGRIPYARGRWIALTLIPPGAKKEKAETHDTISSGSIEARVFEETGGLVAVEAEHCGEPYKIYMDIEQPGLHTIEFSMREDGFEFDKWMMTKDRNFARPAGPGPAERHLARSEQNR